MTGGPSRIEQGQACRVFGGSAPAVPVSHRVVWLAVARSSAWRTESGYGPAIILPASRACLADVNLTQYAKT
ncbi:hypothetical protein RRG08_062777 [Elysia crispata]|uniref:Uncharacterized protein n=1 Tax=Elysia crispata TaxID=231223 RepID=A0AAE0Y5X1_9GAST|nr:hypothetical protein RRG08_062777 [Elysia crispata]